MTRLPAIRAAVGGLSLSIAVVAVPASPAAATPTNGLIAYSLGAVLVPHPDPGASQIYTVRPDGTHRRQLTHVSAPHQAGDPAWSPDGTQIAYVTDVGGPWQVWVMNADGTDQHQLVADPDENAFFPRWSPDGRRLLFTRCITVFQDDECQIAQVLVDGSRLRPMTTGHYLDTSASWAPDGQIAFDSNRSNAQSAIWRTTLSGLQRLTPRSAEAFFPHYRYDGARILYTDSCCRPQSRLHSMRADGTDDRTLSEGCFGGYSPDGRRLSYSGGLTCDDGLVVARADGSDPVTVVATNQLVISDWGPHL